MLPALSLEEPVDIALRSIRSPSDAWIEHRAHLERREELLERAYHVMPSVTFAMDRTGYHAAVHQLNEIAEDCSVADWDGHGAVPISYRMYRKALEFIEALPAGLPQPELIPEADGELALEWRGARGAMLSISLGANGRMTLLYLPDRVRTTIHWTRAELPRSVLALIETFA